MIVAMLLRMFSTYYTSVLTVPSTYYKVSFHEVSVLGGLYPGRFLSWEVSVLGGFCPGRS